MAKTLLIIALVILAFVMSVVIIAIGHPGDNNPNCRTYYAARAVIRECDK